MNPRVFRVAGALLVGACCIAVMLALRGCRPAYAGPYKHVILISMDTTRADHLGCYGGTRVATPNIDRFAARGVVFQQALSAAPTTLASHTSIMTGTYPHTHGVVRNGFMVAAANETLAEILARQGFETAAFLGSFALDRRFAFDQGFELFDDRFEILSDLAQYDQNQRRATAVTDATLAYTQRSKAEHLFLFVHYFDAHEPFDAPPPFDRAAAHGAAPRAARLEDFERAVARQQQRTTGTALGLSGVIGKGLTRALVAQADGQADSEDDAIAAAYAGEIAYVDHELGRLLDGLEQQGLLEHSLVILTADHGETFVEHADYWNHGLCVYDTTVRVPLIVRDPLQGSAHACAVPVSTIDILPTVLDLLRVERPVAVEGLSLAPALRGEPLERGPVFSEATQPPSVEAGASWGNARKARCVRKGRFKYVTTPYLELEELYDLERDPLERDDLLRTPTQLVEGGVQAREVASKLRQECAAWSESARPHASHFNRAQIDETKARLKTLGYVEGDEPPDAPQSSDSTLPKTPGSTPPKPPN